MSSEAKENAYLNIFTQKSQEMRQACYNLCAFVFAQITKEITYDTRNFI